jgi:hypothetical protein
MRAMRIAISGTYSGGKTTTALALSYLTGIQKTHASTMREILPVTFPGKRLEKCVPDELIELGMRRFIERIQAENELGTEFISDGTPLQEWVYGSSRLKVGLNPSEPIWKAQLKKYLKYPQMKVYKETIELYGTIVKKYTQKNYDIFIHLPIEFAFTPDGHRPVSEPFRKACDELLRDTYKELGLKVFEVQGTIEDRLNIITARLSLKHVMNISDAVFLAKQSAKHKFDNVKMEYE